MTNNNIKEITDKLEKGVQELFNSESYTEYLKFMGKFHNYSFCNSMLIWSQMPEATLVAGYKAWQTKFNRNVKKGEKAIKILAPLPHKTKKEVTDENGNVEEKEIHWMTFRAVNVFDVSQTDGEEVPTFTVDELTGEVKGFDSLIQKLTDMSDSEVVFEEITSGAKGFYSLADKKVHVKEGMSEVQTVKTLIHEIAHSKLHGEGCKEKEADRYTREVQAESVAYTVCNYLGIDTSDYSFGYVTSWSSGKELKELMNSMEVIRKTAQEFIEKVA